MLPTAYSPESLIPFPFESMKTLPDRQHNSPTDPPKFVGAMVAISGDNPAPEAPPDVAAAELSCGVVKVAIAVDVVVGTLGTVGVRTEEARNGNRGGVGMDALTAVAMVVFTVAAVVVFEDDEVETTEVVIFTAETDVLRPRRGNSRLRRCRCPGNRPKRGGGNKRRRHRPGEGNGRHRHRRRFVRTGKQRMNAARLEVFAAESGDRRRAQAGDVERGKPRHIHAPTKRRHQVECLRDIAATFKIVKRPNAASCLGLELDSATVPRTREGY